MQETPNMIPVRDADLLPWVKKAESALAQCEWAPKQPMARAGGASAPGIMGSSFISPSVGGGTTLDQVKIHDIAKVQGGGGLIMSDTCHHVLATLKRALQIGYHIDDLYARATGLDGLEKLNAAKQLPPSQVPEFSAKQSTRAAIAVQATASYVVWELGGFRADEASSVPGVEKPTIVEFPLTNGAQARAAMLYYLGKGLMAPEFLDNDLAFLRFTHLYFRAILDEVLLRKDSLQFADAFTGKKYKLEKEEFVIDGWNQLSERSVVSVEFQRMEFTKIVGNRLAKHASRRAVQRLLCYDTVRKMNPMLELGGLAAIRLGHGQPGTGKSMMIAAIATALDDRCKDIGIPFLFHPIPDGLVSTYQGGSAERMDAWMRVLLDPTKIIYAPIDDAENLFKNRANKDVSEGERGVQAVFLRRTEGAYAIQRGNTLIDFCTNLPEQIDPATMSRIVDRYIIDGARTVNDVLDQDELALARYTKIAPDFDNTTTPKGYVFFAEQGALKSVGASNVRYTTPRNERVREIYDSVVGKHSPKEKLFFAEFAVGIQKVFPVFTSRDLRNIHSAVSSRILDFDMPEEWFDDPKRFCLLSYDEKKGMLVDLMRTNMGGLSLADIRLEEFLRYVDGVAEMADTAFERDVANTVYHMRVQTLAHERFKTKQ